jgi:small subunit ribosomal protein S2
VIDVEPQNRYFGSQKVGIPLIGVVDSNHSPIGIDYVIPGNDDSSKAVALYAKASRTPSLKGALRSANEVVVLCRLKV